LHLRAAIFAVPALVAIALATATAPREPSAFSVVDLKRLRKRAALRRTAINLFGNVLTVLTEWSGLPRELYLTPDHLLKFANKLSQPSVWPSLYGLQHDEKDIYRVTGAAGLQDWGDGEAQRLADQLNEATRAAAAAAAALHALLPGAAIPAARYASMKTCFATYMPRLQLYQQRAVERLDKREAHAAKLTAKQAKLGAGKQREIDRLGKQIAFITSQCAEARTSDVSVNALLASVNALPAAPGQEHAPLVCDRQGARRRRRRARTAARHAASTAPPRGRAVRSHRPRPPR